MPVNHVLLETIELSQSAATVTLDNIPQTGYTDLKLVISARATTSANWALVAINGGSDTATTLLHLLNNQGSVITQTYTSLRALIAGSTITANTFSNSELYFTNYASTTANKSISGDGTQEDISINVNQQSAGFRWPFNTAISSLTLTVDGGGSFVAGSTLSLYGIAATGTTPVTAPKAQGGNIVANDGTYWYHAFLASGTFTPTIPLTCDYLVVAGGGGGEGALAGALRGGAGGGAGGLRSTVTATGGGGTVETPLSLLAQNYSVSIGAGGTGGATYNVVGTSGSNSQFSTITSNGGGVAGPYEGNSATGGSGGGQARGSSTLTGPAGTNGQGFKGGDADYSTMRGGSGGGAGAAGAAASSGSSAGIGVAISAFATPTTTGVSSYYAGGGGAGACGTSGPYTAVARSLGGSGGGGDGGTNSSGVSGIANTGGGGGGASDQSSVNRPGGTGGSGIVIIRYTIA